MTEHVHSFGPKGRLQCSCGMVPGEPDIDVSRMGIGLRVKVPCHSKHHAGHGDTIVLSRDEAFDLLAKLQAVCHAWAAPSGGSTGG